ncbi:MAG: two-component system, LytTR family, response regulator NatR [Candidatus Petromonas sp.]|jgi:DNA-binding LytR/AlgR family response regulator|nr:two-component system, LytTR family, response regulator NatR [Candidatus Petromonas sp.]
MDKKKGVKLLHGKVCIKNGKEKLFIPKKAIIMFCKNGRKINIITMQGEFSIYGSLNKIEEKLKSRHFFRSHQSFIINIQKIKKIISSSYENYVVLEGTKERALITRKREKKLYELIEVL